jgi:hypothetical protein
METPLAKRLTEQFSHLLNRNERSFARLRWGYENSPPRSFDEIETILHMDFSAAMAAENEVLNKLERTFEEFMRTGKMPESVPPPQAVVSSLGNPVISEDAFFRLNTSVEERYRSSSVEQRIADFAEKAGAELILNKEILLATQQVGELLIKEIHRHPQTMFSLSSREFEKLVCDLFAGFKYEVELTQATRDGGVDIIAIKHSEVHVRYLIECKHPRPGNKIGVQPVRELYGVKQILGATKAILATSSFFTDDAKVVFDSHRWELEPRDFNGIMDWIKSYVTSAGGDIS